MILLLAQAVFVGNQACAPCHPKIHASYTQTPMARSSGRVTELPSGGLRHASSGAEYKAQPAGAIDWRKGPLRGTQVVDYFIGSGAAGRSFLFTTDGFLFQAPITWYSQKARWDVSPGYEHDREIRWNRAIEPNCLFCHASQARPIYGTQNRYADPPFAQDGVGCERCHGPGSEHVRGAGSLVNPAKLDPQRRDAVCAQCHLSGEARIEKAGQKIAAFRPGGQLTDTVNHFVYEAAGLGGVRATSHAEKLESSRCKQASGDKLWCGSCHNPHPVSNFREKCLTCHELKECGRGQDCVSCHMPRTRVEDGGHGVLTDHSIPRQREKEQVRSNQWKLVGFRGQKTDGRELGLAYAEVGLRTGDRRQIDEAVRLLNVAPPDGEVLVRLADLLQRRGDPARAAPLYQRALRADPNSVVAMVNLGSIYGAGGDIQKAIDLWRQALDRNPGLIEAGINLARALRASGRRQEADKVVAGLRLYQPDLVGE